MIDICLLGIFGPNCYPVDCSNYSNYSKYTFASNPSLINLEALQRKQMNNSKNLHMCRVDLISPKGLHLHRRTVLVTITQRQ